MITGNIFTYIAEIKLSKAKMEFFYEIQILPTKNMDWIRLIFF